MRPCDIRALIGAMYLDAATIEGLAVAFYRRLRLDPAVPVDTFRLARLHLGYDAIERGVGMAGERAKTFVVGGQRRIAISRRLAVDHAQHAVGHELAHDVLEEMGYAAPDVETVCDSLGAALMAPLPAARAMIRTFGRDHEAIADEVVGTQTWAALRIAEVCGIARAVLTTRKVYARGPESFAWGTEASLRRLAKCAQPGPGIARARLTDDPSRIVLDIEDSLAG